MVVVVGLIVGLSKEKQRWLFLREEIMWLWI